ncbi:MAG TPA: hypothetical protein VMF07_15605 [Solirubrobacteraceae bacterium]|nr:hypothetical protein [Solirubrobacteraceae bacterium]
MRDAAQLATKREEAHCLGGFGWDGGLARREDGDLAVGSRYSAHDRGAAIGQPGDVAQETALDARPEPELWALLGGHLLIVS